MNLRSSPAVALGLALALAVLLAGCVPVSAPAPTPEASDELAPYFAQDVEWSGCGEAVECASIEAPLDWAHPATGSIELALSRLPARVRLGARFS